MEQFHLIKQSVREPFEVEKNSQQENYISRLLEDKNYLIQGNKTKSLIIKQLIQSGNTDNYDNDNSCSKSNSNDESNNSGIEINDVNIQIPNDDSNITMRHCNSKSSKYKSTYVNNKDKNSNKINTKKDNNKNNTKKNTIKATSPAESGSNDTIINISKLKEKCFHSR